MHVFIVWESQIHECTPQSLIIVYNALLYAESSHDLELLRQAHSLRHLYLINMILLLSPYMVFTTQEILNLRSRFG